MSTTSGDEVLSWTSQDPRQSTLFSNYGVLYRFSTEVHSDGRTVTTLWRAIRANKEDRVARLEWSSAGGFGRAVLGKNTYPMADLVRPVGGSPPSRAFNGPDGYQYRWQPSQNRYNDILLLDYNNATIAFYRPVLPVKYNLGDVYGELHFCRRAGAGVVMHPPLMDTVTVTAMLYLFAEKHGL